ncbi:MAG: Bug family tripartite tricarboxylate transporter substrate binding protein [Xanthobacteraceae bacterium]
MIARRAVVMGSAFATFGFGPIGFADDLPTSYPSGPITFVVAFPPGGSIDAVMRAIAPKLQERLGKPVVIENRAGAGGNVAAVAVAKAIPDGQTLLAPASSLAANPTLVKHMPFDTLRDLQAVALLFRTPLALVVHPSVPAKSVTELLDLLRQKPGEITFGHSGTGAAIFLAAELFQSMTGTRMNGIAYRGAPPALNDVMAGHVALMFADAGSVVSQINAGRVRALGVSSVTRVPALQEVPTIAESGVPGFDAVGWTMICAPAATPTPIINRLHGELNAVMALPEIRDFVLRLGIIPVESPPPSELQSFLASEIERWGRVIERAGLARTE